MAGYSGTPLPKKLGIQKHFRMCLLGMPSEVKAELKEALASCRVAKDGQERLDFAMIFVKTAVDLKRDLARLSTRLAPAGMLWVSWPKKASGVSTDLKEDEVRRIGLAAGLTAAGFGAGSALTVIPIQYVIQHQGYQSAFLWFGLGQGLVVLVLAWFLAAPLAGEVPSAVQKKKVPQSPFSATWIEALRSPIFWVLYAMFVVMAASGLILLAQFAPIAKDFKVADVTISFLGITGPVLIVAASLDNVLNGLARPFFGWVSDNIGRELTMFLVFTGSAVSMWGITTLGRDPVFFVAFFALSFFTWGEIFSLFPSTCTDTFGTKYATTNAGLLYTAKGTGALVVPLANVLVGSTGDWHAVFMLAAAMNLLTGVVAITVLKPMRRAHYDALGIRVSDGTVQRGKRDSRLG